MDNLSEMSEEELRGDGHGVQVYGHSGVLVGDGDAQHSPSASSHGVVLDQAVLAQTPVNSVHTHGAGEVFSAGVLTARPPAVSRVVVVTSHGALSASSHTLTLHRIQVKEELQTAAEDLSVSASNESNQNNNNNNNHHHSTSSSAPSSHHHPHHHPPHHSQHPQNHHHSHPHHHHQQQQQQQTQQQHHHHQQHQQHQHHQENDSERDEDLEDECGNKSGDGATTLTVIVPGGNEDSSEAQLLSPKLSPSSGISVSVQSMIDASEFRGLQQEHGYQALSSVNGRLSPQGFSPGQASSQYATLTPLQPLPPISTMSDKFSYGHAGNVAGSFTVMHNNGLANLGMGVTSPYSYEKLSSMGMSPPHYSSPTNGLGLGLSHQPSPSISPQHYSQNGLSSPPKALSPNGYDSYESGGGGSAGSGTPNPHTPQSSSQPRDLRQSLHGVGGSHSHSPSLSPPGPGSVGTHGSPPPHHLGFGVATGVALTSSMPGVNGLAILSPHSSSPDNSPPLAGATAVVVTHRNASSPPSSSAMSMTSVMSGSSLVTSTGMPAGASLTTQAVITAHSGHSSSSHPHISHTGNVTSGHVTHVVNSGSMAIKTATTLGGGGGPNVNLTSTPAGSGNSGGSSISGSGELEEINTKELAARISAELKRYSIPQAIFAQRVLCRSQGTLSDLLRNPKPWSKLKSGRETFRRMWKWLQEPEFQRMSALRLAGAERGSAPRQPQRLHEIGRVGAFGDQLEFGKPTMHSSSCMQVNLGFNCGSEEATLSGIACKRKEEQQSGTDHPPAPKKPRLVFTDLQRRTLQAIFKETKRPSKEMQVTIARQLGLEPTTVGNFFMNARRRSMDKWKEESDGNKVTSSGSNGSSNASNASNHTVSSTSSNQQQQLSHLAGGQTVNVTQVVTVHHTGLNDSASPHLHQNEAL
ncbi:unnamed protein product [Allacma fusca]|uniref:One cut domain family member n=1 Tax=Allacma fusca TaxID=39272 RepID=A0A8J2PP48_9HEXA|nr:unnamed protein product [Allacma fusca]